MMHSYHNRSYRLERRRPGRRILGWIVALVPWCILAVLWWGS